MREGGDVRWRRGEKMEGVRGTRRGERMRSSRRWRRGEEQEEEDDEVLCWLSVSSQQESRGRSDLLDAKHLPFGLNLEYSA